MITRNALYDFIENLIRDADAGTALDEAFTFRNLRTSVDDARKLIRVECFDGQHAMTAESCRKELGVSFTIQCWVLPDEELPEQIAIDEAIDLSFDMSRQIFEGIASDTSLNGAVCDSYANEFETGESNLGTTRRGVTYLDGIINQAS